MVDLSFLRENQRIELEIFRNGKSEKFPSRVEELSENAITISSPLYRGEIVPVNMGEKIKIIINVDNGILQFEITVLDRKKIHNINCLVVSKPESLQKIQRRNFFRIKCQVDVEYRKLVEISQFCKDPFIKTSTKDISGGGLLLVAHENVTKESILEVIIHLPKYGEINTVGKVVMVKDGVEDTKGKKEIALEFVVIEEKDREKIVKFIFEKQREQRYKEFKWVDRIGS